MHCGVSLVLDEPVRHLLLLLPDADHDALCGLAGDGPAAALDQLRRLILLVKLHERVLLLANADAWLSNAARDAVHDGKLVDLVDLRPILGLFLLLVVLQTWPVVRDGPGRAVFPVNGRTMHYVRLRPLLLLLVKPMLDHMDKAFPAGRHFDSSLFLKSLL